MSAVLLAACPADDDANDGTASETDPSSSSDPSTTVSATVTVTDPTVTDTNPTATDPTGTDTSSTEVTTTVDPDSSSSSGSSDTGSSSGSSDSGSSDSGSSDSGSSTGEPEVIVVINELSSNNNGKLGADPIEIYNAGEGVADISGWVLTDDLTDPYDPEVDLEELVFPKGTTLSAGDFLIVVGGDAEGNHPFGLSGGGDTARLFDAELNEIDAVTYGDMEAAVSYCRMPDGPDGAWQADCAETFGASNG